MPTSPKPAARATAKRATKKAAEPDTKPFLRFHHSQQLRIRTLEVLETVENAEKPTAYSAHLTELVLELTDSGMDQYFLQSLKATKTNFVVQQSAALGLSGVQKVMGTVIRNIIGRMDDRQLLSVCGSIRQFMAWGLRNIHKHVRRMGECCLGLADRKGEYHLAALLGAWMKQLERLLFLQGNRCFFCGDKIPEGEASVEHLVASSNGGAKDDENCVVCCKAVNAALGNLSIKAKLQAVLNQQGQFTCPGEDSRSPASTNSPRSQAPLPERVALVVADLQKRGPSRPRRVATLKNTMNSVFQMTLSDEELDELLSNLQFSGYVIIEDTKVSYALPAGA